MNQQQHPTAPGQSLTVRRDGVLWRQLDDQILVLDVTSSRYLRLNATGAALWHALGEPQRHEDLVHVLQAQYGISRQDAIADVAEFVARLDHHGLLEVVR